MNDERHSPASSLRLMTVVISVFLLSAVMLWRAVDLHVFNKDFLQRQGDARYMRVEKVNAHRGIITDRNGEPLAVSTPVDSIWVNPKDFLADEKPRWKQLAVLLEMDIEQLKSVILSRAEREFVYLKRHAHPDTAAKIEQLNMAGVYLQREYKRYYPTGEVSAHVLGFTNVDDAGQEGMELAYDKWLQGLSGEKLVIKDRLGRVVKHVEMLKAARPGNALRLSLDRRLQYLVYRELKSAVKKHKARSASAVILDVNSGEVLAMVNQPSYNPNNRSRLNSSALRNRAVTDVFEPGSTIKPFTVSAALANGRYRADSIIDTSPGFYAVGNYVVQDIRNYGRLDMRNILIKSSNVGATQLALNIPARQLSHLHSQLGFGDITGSGFPGEAAGKLTVPEEKRLVERATLSYGYGLSVTSLQLARAYAALAANGVIRPVSFIANDKTVTGKQIISKKISSQVRTMLEGVVSDEGTGKLASVSGYRVAGKTGTVKKASEGGYSEDRYVAVFAGFAPVSDPKLAMVVMVNEPRGDEYYGGSVAAPVFAKTMAGALRLLDIPPDDIQAGSNLFAFNTQHGSKP